MFLGTFNNLVVNLPITRYYHLDGNKIHLRIIPGGYEMKKYAMILMGCLMLFGCSSNNVNTNEEKNNSVVDAEETSNETKAFSQKEEAFITNLDGEKVYSITIDSVKEFTVEQDYKEYVPSDSAQTVVITYTYKFIEDDPGNMDSLYIRGTASKTRKTYAKQDST